VDHDGTFVKGDPAKSIANAASSAGDFKYRFGASMNYTHPSADGDTGDRASWGKNGTIQLWGASGVSWIPKNFYTNGPQMFHNEPYDSGWGELKYRLVYQTGNNFLIFDNHSGNNNPLGGGSHVLEIDPTVMTRTPARGSAVMGGTPGPASYTRTTDNGQPFAFFPERSAGYYTDITGPGNGTVFSGLGYGTMKRSNQVVWDYTPSHPSTLDSGHLGNAQRLPNGNTLICSGETGQLVEVMYDSGNQNTGFKLVWEYINPMTRIVTGENCPDLYPGGACTPLYATEARKYVHNADMSNDVFSAYRFDIKHPGLKRRLIAFSDGTILPKVVGPGIGATLTGAAPCTNIPCSDGN